MRVRTTSGLPASLRSSAHVCAYPTELFVKRLLSALSCSAFLFLSSGCPKKVDLAKVESKAKPASNASERDWKSAKDSFEKNPVSSIATFEVFVSTYPQDPMVPAAYVYMARGYLAQQDYAKAKEVSTMATTMAAPRDKDLKKAAQYTTAMAEVGLGNGASQLDVLASLKDAFSDPAENAKVSLALGEAAASANQNRRALAAFSESYERSESQADKLYAVIRSQGLAPLLSIDEAIGLYNESPKDSLAAAALASRVASEFLSQGKATQAADVLSDTKASRVSFFGTDTIDGLSIKGADSRAIGAVLPLTGKTSRIGRLFLRGLFFAAEGAAKPGEASPYRLVIRDSGSTPEGAKAATEELAKLENVIAIIGPSDADEASAAAKAAQASNTPMISMSLSPNVTNQGDMIFWASVDNDLEARSLARYAAENKLTKVAILAPETAYGKSMAEAFAQEATDKGAKVVANVSYAEGATSWAKQIKTIKDAKPQAIFIPEGAKVLGAIAPALAASGLWSVAPGKKPPKGAGYQLLAPSPAISDKLLSDAGTTIEGALFATVFFSQDPKTKSFSVDFSNREKEPPTMFDAISYEAFLFVKGALQTGATSRGALRDTLQTGSFDGLSGSVAFGEDHRADRTLTMVRVNKGKFEAKK
jgi:branched-chain amino acid transport system substrate-binding protein